MDYTEICFILSEAARRGLSVGGTAEQHYINGITSSMTEWGVSAADLATYLASDKVTLATAPGTDKEKIANQFWISMYNRGFEGGQFTEYLILQVLQNSGTLRSTSS